MAAACIPSCVQAPLLSCISSYFSMPVSHETKTIAYCSPGMIQESLSEVDKGAHFRLYCALAAVAKAPLATGEEGTEGRAAELLTWPSS
ncbi:hypothetical protein An16g00610 [Aspergillus niger]|uniref:Uncharacterized protein n=2 Tax=Aspergillus niger TaxID=5061 RepID=A2R6N3_ASPNC|nr:hypothetical protein An16g00610 [Aspergillus niger]CAK46748.1 hypothetical protein An16g00610 [Aspergillus niger]